MFTPSQPSQNLRSTDEGLIKSKHEAMIILVSRITICVSDDDEPLVEIQQAEEGCEEQIEPPEDNIHMENVHNAESPPVEPPQRGDRLMTDLHEVRIRMTIHQASAVVEHADFVILLSDYYQHGGVRLRRGYA